MTNRFKFRLWDKAHRIMTDNPINSINFNGQILLNDGNYHDIENSDYILMQSTGLTDCNGKEIFEGDIFKQSEETQLSIYKLLCYE